MAGDLADGEETQVKGSGSSVYTLKNSGGVYSCTCPAWMHQGLPIEKRTCKHLRAFRGDEAETKRLGSAGLLSGKPSRPKKPKAPGEAGGEEDDDAEGPPVLLAHKWENDVELSGWWISEKLDGVRAYWDGTQFLSRLGNKFFAPPWFTEKFPKHPLDGELWGGRKQFQRTVGIVKRQDETPLWKELQYVVFDAPAHGGIFEERIAFIEQLVKELKVDWLRACEHVQCTDVEHLKRELSRVEGLGGEGLMVRQPRSRYEAGRSSTLLKVKNFHDSEARVIGHVPGAGRHKGRLGALLVEMPDGTQFNVGTGFSDAEREKPPAIGAIITYRYQELSNAGVPRFPSYVCERIDAKFHSTAVPGVSVRRVDAIKGSANGAPPPAVSRPAAPAARASPAPTRGNMATRRFEMTDGDTRYFWEIETTGSKQKVRQGTFEDKEKTFGDADEAAESAEKEIAKKLGKGFKEVAVGGAAAASSKKKSPFDDDDEDDAPAPAAKPAAKPAPAAAAPKPAAAASSGGKSSKVDEPGRRYFEFVEGTSSKFWEIRVEGSTFFTRYGKIGTDGQTTQKDYDSEEKAQAEAEKLISEKTRKGYEEK
ncbi:MAG: DNA ligase [Myxococcaceae bacterium]